MGWSEVTAVDQRRKFMQVLHSEDNPGVAALCREFSISRKTGYKWIARYRELGEDGLVDLSRASHSHPNSVSAEMEQLVIEARQAHPSWGAKKLLPWLQRKNPQGEKWPCVATVSSILERNQLVRSRKRRKTVAAFQGERIRPGAANDRWCIDHKGWWLARNGDKCEPFTVTDEQTRFLIRCTLCAGKGIDYVRPVLMAAFREFGLPLTILSDNGPPFASRAPLGLAELSVWFMRLGICHERIDVGEPQQNGCHERMHLTMENDRTQPVAASMRSEQKRLNIWREEFNHERPHEALHFATPASCYISSPRAMPRKLPEFDYDSALRVRKVDKTGKFCWRGRDLFLTEALRGQWIGFEAEDCDGQWSVWLGLMRLGTFDERQHKMNWANQMARRPG